MNAITPIEATATTEECLDVLIVGAGISGIGMAVHLRKDCPGKSFAILDRREQLGGTWDLFRYPGIRSDSDLFTFGYRFKPWEGPPIASGAEIMRYLGEVIEEYALGPQIRYGRRVVSADWRSAERHWAVRVAVAVSEEIEEYTAHFLWSCAGSMSTRRGSTRSCAARCWPTRRSRPTSRSPIRLPPSRC